MAESPPIEEPGAPIAKDAIDPDLIKLKRARPKVGVITAAGVVFLCTVFLVRLNGDRKFGGASTPERTTVAEVVAGNVGTDRFVTLDAEPLMAHAIRASTHKGALGLRVAPARGTGERLWLVLPGDGWEQPSTEGYTGRLRKLSALPFAAAIEDYAAANPRPMFAAASATRAGFASGKVATIAGETVTVNDADQVALDVVDPGAALLVATINERFPSAQAWVTALTAAGITVGAPAASPSGATDQVRFEVTAAGAVASTMSKLEAASLWAVRVEPITRHYKTTWGALKASSAAGFAVAQGVTVPDGDLDLVGLYVARDVPDGAYAMIVGERPADYWYVLPITVGLALIGLLFLWALIRAVRRDLLPPARAG